VNKPPLTNRGGHLDLRYADGGALQCHVRVTYETHEYYKIVSKFQIELDIKVVEIFKITTYLLRNIQRCWFWVG
jgi:hypothetical protein